jgi:hypothetical protein
VTFCDVSGIRDENSDDQRGNGKTIDQRKMQDARAVEKGIEGEDLNADCKEEVNIVVCNDDDSGI